MPNVDRAAVPVDDEVKSITPVQAYQMRISLKGVSKFLFLIRPPVRFARK
jgi:hypothetical protein